MSASASSDGGQLTAVLRVIEARRLPGPDGPADDHIFNVKLQDLVGAKVSDYCGEDACFVCEGLERKHLPWYPNPRKPSEKRLRKRVYKDVQAGAKAEESVPSLFGRRHGGLQVVARHVERVDDDTYRLVFDRPMNGFPGHGILNGASSYASLLKIADEVHEEAWLRMIVTAPTGTDEEQAQAIVDTAEGLNTTENVSGYTTADARKKFEHLKEALGDYAESVEWREGDDRPMKVAHLIALMFAMNPVLYPVKGRSQPTGAYSSPTTTLNRYLNKDEVQETVDRLLPIVSQVAKLHDHIQGTAQVNYNTGGRNFGNLKVATGSSSMAFTTRATEPDYVLHRGALFPIIAAFRLFVDAGDDEFSWNVPFDEVIATWDRVAVDMIGSVNEIARDEGGSDKCGKSSEAYTAAVLPILMDQR